MSPCDDRASWWPRRDDDVLYYFTYYVYALPEMIYTCLRGEAVYIAHGTPPHMACMISKSDASQRWFISARARFTRYQRNLPLKRRFGKMRATATPLHLAASFGACQPDYYQPTISVREIAMILSTRTPPRCARALPTLGIQVHRRSAAWRDMSRFRFLIYIDIML